MVISSVVDVLAGEAMASSCAAVVVVRDGRPEFIEYDGDEAGIEERLRHSVASGGFVVAIVALRSRDGIAGQVVIQGLGGWEGTHAKPLLRRFAYQFVRHVEEVFDAHS